MKTCLIVMCLLCCRFADAESYVLTEAYPAEGEIEMVSTEMVVEKQGENYILRGKLKDDYGGKTAKLVLKTRTKQIVDLTFEFEWMFEGRKWDAKYAGEIYLDSPEDLEKKPLTDILLYVDGVVAESVDGEKSKGRFVLIKVTGNGKKVAPLQD